MGHQVSGPGPGAGLMQGTRRSLASASLRLSSEIGGSARRRGGCGCGLRFAGAQTGVGGEEEELGRGRQKNLFLITIIIFFVYSLLSARRKPQRVRVVQTGPREPAWRDKPSVKLWRRVPGHSPVPLFQGSYVSSSVPLRSFRRNGPSTNFGSFLMTIDYPSLESNTFGDLTTPGSSSYIRQEAGYVGPQSRDWH